MDEAITHLVVNYIIVAPDEIIVGATDNERWRWDTKDGYSGADARTSVMVRLVLPAKASYAIGESASYFCSPGDTARAISIAGTAALLTIAWQIQRAGDDQKTARAKYFGQAIHP